MEIDYEGVGAFNRVMDDISRRCYYSVYGEGAPIDDEKLLGVEAKIWRKYPEEADRLNFGLREQQISLKEYHQGWLKLADEYAQARFLDELEAKLSSIQRFQNDNPMLTANFPAAQYELPVGSKKEEPFL